MDAEFGNKTIVYVANLLAAMETDDGIRMFLYGHRLDGEYAAAPGGSKRFKLFNMFKALRDSDDDGLKSRMREALSEFIPRAYERLPSSWDVERGPQAGRVTAEQFLSVLRAEGWEVVEGRLIPYPATSVSLSGEKGKLERTLERLKFRTALGHLSQAVDNMARGNWAAANAQTRTFLEAVFDEMAARRWTGTDAPPRRGQGRQYLESEGLLDPEVDGPLVKALFTALHAEGSHPGLSDAEDSQNRLLMAVAVAGRYLARL